MRKNIIENNSGEAQKEQYVLDTYAVLCYLRDEEGADLVAALLKAGKHCPKSIVQSPKDKRHWTSD
ncbi:MAG: hypothetical protein STSR0004_04280 [Peptococcaceae bacterium]